MLHVKWIALHSLNNNKMHINEERARGIEVVSVDHRHLIRRPRRRHCRPRRARAYYITTKAGLEINGIEEACSRLAGQ